MKYLANKLFLLIAALTLIANIAAAVSLDEVYTKDGDTTVDIIGKRVVVPVVKFDIFMSEVSYGTSKNVIICIGTGSSSCAVTETTYIRPGEKKSVQLQVNLEEVKDLQLVRIELRNEDGTVESFGDIPNPGFSWWAKNIGYVAMGIVILAAFIIYMIALRKKIVK